MKKIDDEEIQYTSVFMVNSIIHTNPSGIFDDGPIDPPGEIINDIIDV